MTTNSALTNSASFFGSLKALGRGVALSSAVAVMGVSTMSAADASAAGVSTGIRHASATTASASQTPTDISLESHARYAVRDGKLRAL